MGRLLLVAFLLVGLVCSPAEAVIDMYGFARSEPRVEVIGGTSTQATYSTTTPTLYYSQPIPPGYIGALGRLRITVFINTSSLVCTGGVSPTITVSLGYGTGGSLAQTVSGQQGDGVSACILPMSGNIFTFWIIPSSPTGSTPRQVALYGQSNAFGNSTSASSPGSFTTAALLTTVDPSQAQTLTITVTGPSASGSIRAEGVYVERIPGIGTAPGSIGNTLP